MEREKLGVFDRIQKILNGPDNSGYAGRLIARSPDSSGGLASAIFDDVTGLEGPVSVGQALAVPAISKAVDLYTAAIVQMTLTPSAESDSTRWLNWSDGPISPPLRNALIFQDLFFHRFACLAVARDAAGMIENGLHIPRYMWQFDGDGRVLVNGEPTPQDQVLLIPSFKPLGLLTYAQETIRQYLSIARTVSDRLDNPVPMLGIKSDIQADDDEVDKALTDWSLARKAKGGATAHIPPGVTIETPGADRDDASLMIGARNAARIDAANFTNLPASMLDGSSGASEDYGNTLQAANEFIKLSVSLYTRAIEARLSQDDVTPEGVTVSFDAASFDTLTTSQGNTGTATGSAPAATLTQGDTTS